MGYFCSLVGLAPLLRLFFFVMLAVAAPTCPCPTVTFGRPTMLEPTVPLGETECTFGCTSVVPVPDMAPTGLFMNEFVLLDLLCKMLSIVLSMKTRLFFIVSCLGELESVWFLSFVDKCPPPGWLRGSANEPESPLMPLPTVMPVN